MCIDEKKKLWKDVFGDSDTYIDDFFNTIYDEKNVLVHCDNGNVVAALYMIPYKMKYDKNIFNVMYLYALATDAAYRGRGIMSDLIRKSDGIISKRGYAGSFLIPANKNLYKYYSRFGYDKVIKNRQFINIEKNYLENRFHKSTADNSDLIYTLDNAKEVSERILISPEQSNFSIQTFLSEGGKVYLSDDCKKYILVWEHNDILKIYDTNVKELIDEKYVDSGLLKINSGIIRNETDFSRIYIGRVLD